VSTEGNELSLEGLAQRLEALERENASLQREVVALAGGALAPGGEAARRGSGTRRSADAEQATESAGPGSRRKRLNQARVDAVAPGTSLNSREARASNFGPAISVETVNTHLVDIDNQARGGNCIVASTSDPNFVTAFFDNTGSGGPGINVFAGEYGIRADGTTGVWGQSNAGDGGIGVRGEDFQRRGTRVRGEGGTGVKGEGDTGVWGSSSKSGHSGVYGQHTGSGFGVVGDGIGSSRAGVLGRNSSGAGVKGEGTFAGVSGSSSMPGSFSDLPSGVYGEHTGQGGYGVRGFGDTGVLGQGHKGDGVRGQSTSRFYAGVYGENTSTGILGGPGGGIGGRFKGGRAQVMLEPNASSGSPETGEHSKGELFMDSAADLFVCVASSTATAMAEWKKVATTAV